MGWLGGKSWYTSDVANVTVEGSSGLALSVNKPDGSSRLLPMIIRVLASLLTAYYRLPSGIYKHYPVR